MERERRIYRLATRRVRMLVASLALTLTVGSSISVRAAEALDLSAFDALDFVDLRVRVVDPEGVPLPGATIRIAAIGGDPRGLLADRNGEAVFAATPCDRRFHVQASFPGFVSVRLESLELCRVLSDGIRVRLEQEVVEAVSCVCRRAVVDLESATSSSVFSSGFMTGLPGAPGSESIGLARASLNRKAEVQACVVRLGRGADRGADHPGRTARNAPCAGWQVR